MQLSICQKRFDLDCTCFKYHLFSFFKDFEGGLLFTSVHREFCKEIAWQSNRLKWPLLRGVRFKINHVGKDVGITCPFVAHYHRIQSIHSSLPLSKKLNGYHFKNMFKYVFCHSLKSSMAVILKTCLKMCFSSNLTMTWQFLWNAFVNRRKITSLSTWIFYLRMNKNIQKW